MFSSRIANSRTRVKLYSQKAMLMNRSHMFDGPISGLPAAKCVREFIFIQALSIHIVLQGNPRSPESSSIFFLLGLSAVQPMFGDLDISSYKQIGGIMFPPLLTLALSFLYALTRSKSDAKGICLRTLLGCWCDYTKFCGYKPLGCDAMEGQPLEEKLMSFWVRGTLY